MILSVFTRSIGCAQGRLICSRDACHSLARFPNTAPQIALSRDHWMVMIKVLLTGPCYEYDFSLFATFVVLMPIRRKTLKTLFEIGRYLAHRMPWTARVILTSTAVLPQGAVGTHFPRSFITITSRYSTWQTKSPLYPVHKQCGIIVLTAVRS